MIDTWIVSFQLSTSNAFSCNVVWTVSSLNIRKLFVGPHEVQCKINMFSAKQPNWFYAVFLAAERLTEQGEEIVDCGGGQTTQVSLVLCSKIMNQK